MRATDPDCGVNAMVNYTLAAGRMESEQLMVRSDTGDICVRTPLDRETAPYLEIPVIATDRGMYTYIYICTRVTIFDFIRDVTLLFFEKRKNKVWKERKFRPISTRLYRFRFASVTNLS